MSRLTEVQQSQSGRYVQRREKVALRVKCGNQERTTASQQSEQQVLRRSQGGDGPDQETPMIDCQRRSEVVWRRPAFARRWPVENLAAGGSGSSKRWSDVRADRRSRSTRGRSLGRSGRIPRAFVYFAPNNETKRRQRRGRRSLITTTYGYLECTRKPQRISSKPTAPDHAARTRLGQPAHGSLRLAREDHVNTAQRRPIRESSAPAIATHGTLETA